jgi:hypothetical protein
MREQAIRGRARALSVFTFPILLKSRTPSDNAAQSASLAAATSIQIDVIGIAEAAYGRTRRAADNGAGSRVAAYEGAANGASGGANACAGQGALTGIGAAARQSQDQN